MYNHDLYQRSHPESKGKSLMLEIRSGDVPKVLSQYEGPKGIYVQEYTQSISGQRESMYRNTQSMRAQGDLCMGIHTKYEGPRDLCMGIHTEYEGPKGSMYRNTHRV